MSRIRKKIFVILATVFGILVGLCFCEFILRVAYNPDHIKPRYPVGNKSVNADCYPTDRSNRFPINLRTPHGMAFFERLMPIWEVYDANLEEQMLQEIRKGNSENAQMHLAREAPYCLFYNHSSDSLRVAIRPAEAKYTIALIGDSFAYGQGVWDNATFGYFLAMSLKVQVLNYARMGADLRQIEKQFDKVMADLSRHKIRKLFYLFVLNDPIRSHTLEHQQQFINDFMNYRNQKISVAPTYSSKIGHMLIQKSYLVHLFMNRLIFSKASKATTEWYEKIYSEVENPHLIESFDIISAMRTKANAMGVDFYLIIYPLMTDMNRYPFATIHAKIRELSEGRAVPTIDLLPAFTGYMQNELIVHPVDYHPNGHAHKIAALETTRQISRHEK